MIALLLRARFVVFAASLGSLVALLLFGREVRYDQSIESFFAEDDPAVRRLPRGVGAVRQRPVRLRRLPRPGPADPRGDRPGRRTGRGDPGGRDRRRGVGCSRSTRCPCSGSSTTPCSPWRNCPRRSGCSCRAGPRCSTSSSEVSPAKGAASGPRRPSPGRSDRRATTRIGWRSSGRRSPSHPLLEGTLVDGSGTDHGPDRPAQVGRRARRQGDGRRACGRSPTHSPSGTGCAPAGGGRAAGAAGRRLPGDRGRRPAAGDGRHAADRPGDADRDAEPLVGGRPADGRLDRLAGDRDVPRGLRPAALALQRADGGADHRPDDAGGQPPGPALPRRPAGGSPTAARRPARRSRAVSRADPLVCPDGDGRLRGLADEQRRADPAVRRRAGDRHLRRVAADAAALADGDDAAPSGWRSRCGSARPRGSRRRWTG